MSEPSAGLDWKLLWHGTVPITKIEHAKDWRDDWYIAISKKSNNYFPEMLAVWTNNFKHEQIKTEHPDLLIYKIYKEQIGGGK